jgi:hypothetical protein
MPHSVFYAPPPPSIHYAFNSTLNGTEQTLVGHVSLTFQLQDVEVPSQGTGRGDSHVKLIKCIETSGREKWHPSKPSDVVQR